MIEFNLTFHGWRNGKRQTINCTYNVASLAHPVTEESEYFLAGQGDSEEVILIISNISLDQKEPGIPKTVVTCELDMNEHCDNQGQVSIGETHKIERVLKYNGWQWDVPVGK